LEQISSKHSGQFKEGLSELSQLCPEVANETKFWLALLRDAGKAASGSVDPLLQEAKELSNILAASIITLKKK
jgi:hypothetical protein